MPDQPLDRSTGLQALIGAAGGNVLDMAGADVGAAREGKRRRRWVKLAALVYALVGVLWLRALTYDGSGFVPLPSIDPFLLTIIIFFGLLLGLAVGQQVLSGRSPHTVFRPDQIQTTLDDVVGIDGVKDDVIRSLNLFLAHKTFRDEMGGTPRRGLLFEGAPGTGKTHLATAMAREAGVPFLFVSATSFQSMWYGASAKKIRSYFKALRKAARKEGGAIGFIEEIDAIATSRGGVTAGMSALNGFAPVSGTTFAGCQGTACLPAAYASLAVHGASSPATVTNALMSEGTGGVVNELLVQMQSFDNPTGGQRLQGWFVDKLNLFLAPHRQLSRPDVVPTNILLIAATNRADSLDPALLRPGRFDRRVTVQPPDKVGREAILRVHTRSVPLEGEVDLSGIASSTPGMVGADLANLINEAALLAARRGHKRVNRQDLGDALERVVLGAERKVVMSEEERERTAYHEAGHALVGMLTPGADPVRKVSIIPRGMALGVTLSAPESDRFNYDQAYLRSKILVALGGRVAEEVVYGNITTGAESDIQQLTGIARGMVTRWGMSEVIGPIAVDGQPSNGMLLPGAAETSQATQELIDHEVRRIVDEAHHDVTLLLNDRRDQLETLTRSLLQEETLDEDQSYAAARVPHPTPAERQAIRDERDAARAALSPGEPSTPEGDRPDGGGSIGADERPGLEIAPHPGVPEPTHYDGPAGLARPEKPRFS